MEAGLQNRPYKFTNYHNRVEHRFKTLLPIKFF